MVRKEHPRGRNASAVGPLVTATPSAAPKVSAPKSLKRKSHKVHNDVKSGASGEQSPGDTFNKEPRPAGTSHAHAHTISKFKRNKLEGYGLKHAKFRPSTKITDAKHEEVQQASKPSSFTSLSQTCLGVPKAASRRVESTARKLRRKKKLDKRDEERLALQTAVPSASLPAAVVSVPKSSAKTCSEKSRARNTQETKQAALLKPPKVAGKGENPRLTQAKEIYAKAKALLKLAKKMDTAETGSDSPDLSNDESSEGESEDEPAEQRNTDLSNRGEFAITALDPQEDSSAQS